MGVAGGVFVGAVLGLRENWPRSRHGAGSSRTPSAQSRAIVRNVTISSSGNIRSVWDTLPTILHGTATGVAVNW